MFSRRQVLMTMLTSQMVSPIYAQEPAPRRVVGSGDKAAETFEKIAQEGGKITSVTIHYDLPAPKGMFSRGSTFVPGDIWKVE